MSQRLSLDLSSASARSIGQARRRNQCEPPEDAREAQHDGPRVKRVKFTETGATEQQLQSSQPQRVCRVNRHQNGSPSRIKGEASPKIFETPLIPHVPAFHIWPTHGTIDHGAVSQSSQICATHLEVPDSKDLVRLKLYQIKDVSPKIIGHGPDIGAEQSDIDAAETLIGIARERAPILLARDTGALLAEELDSGLQGDKHYLASREAVKNHDAALENLQRIVEIVALHIFGRRHVRTGK